MNTSRKNFIRKSSFATMANLVSMLSSVLLSLVLPKFVSIDSFGYWQMFILYSSFVGFFHFGFCDGLYLYLGGKSFNQLNFNYISPAIRIYLLTQLIICIIIALSSLFFGSSWIEKFIWISISVYLFIANSTTLFTMILLATNEIEYYGKIMIITRISLIILTSCIIFSPINHKIIWIIPIYLFSYGLECYLLTKFFPNGFLKNIESISLNKEKAFFTEMISIGFVLMIANVASNLIIGSGRITVQYLWDISVFAKLSFSVSISMFFIAFLSSLSYVIFPILKNQDINILNRIIGPADELIGFFMIILMLLIYPLNILVNKFLPAYIESLEFVLYLLPACLFLAKTQILYNAIYKSLNLQKKLLLINIYTLSLAILGYSIFSHYHNLSGIAMTMLIACAFRFFLMRYYIRKIVVRPISTSILIETLYIIFFVVFYNRINIINFLFFSTIFYLVDLFAIKKTISHLLK